VSRGGYYQWLATSDSPDKDYEDYLTIKGIFDKGKKKWGFRAVKMHLKEDRGIIMNHKKIIRIMNKYHLITKIRKRNPYKDIMKKTLEHRAFKNKLNREFEQEIPRTFFCTDITYMFFNKRPAYLSVVKDIASGEVISWELSRRINMDLVLSTVRKMKKNVPSLNNILIHSDQGFHYTSPAYIDMIENLNMVQSMSRKGNCIDNAPIESFFGHMKDEIEYKDCETFGELYKIIAEYMDYYNNKRYQWNLKKMTPVQYRNHLLCAV